MQQRAERRQQTVLLSAERRPAADWRTARCGPGVRLAASRRRRRPARSRNRASSAVAGSWSRRAPAARLVDPGSGWPAGAGPHQRGMQRAVGFDGETRHAAVEQGDGAGLEGFGDRRQLAASTRISASSRSSDDRRDRGGQVPGSRAVDDQHRQRDRRSQVGVRNPYGRQRRRCRHPDPRPAGLGQLPGSSAV